MSNYINQERVKDHLCVGHRDRLVIHVLGVIHDVRHFLMKPLRNYVTESHACG